jgi:hypothetical protein
MSGYVQLFRRGVFFKIGEMVTNQKVLSNRASDKSRLFGVGSIMTAVSIALQKGGTLHTYQKVLALYNAERRVWLRSSRYA